MVYTDMEIEGCW